MNKKSYYMKSKGGNIARVTFDSKKKPSKKTVEALSKLIDIAYSKELTSKLPQTNETKTDKV